MESFTLRWPRVGILLGLGRNDLLRISDRVESIATAIVVIIAIVAIPMAAAVGTSIHETRSKANAEYVASLHHIKASVVGDGTPKRESLYKVVYSTPVRWNAAGGDRTATVQWSEMVRPEDHIMVWVNESGELTEGPAPVDQAARDGISIAIMLWSTVVAVSAGTTVDNGGSTSGELRSGIEHSTRWPTMKAGIDSTGLP